MKIIKALSATVLLGAVLVTLPAAAQEGVPEMKTMGGISYTSGGIGETERDAMRQQAKDYNLRLSFAVHSGAYLSDVKVDIRDAKGHTLVDDVSDGPWFFAKLAPGKYKVTAEANGKTLTRVVSMAKGRHVSADMVWSE